VDIQQRYSGVSRLNPQPWYKSTTWEPWEEEKEGWIVSNKYRRKIISALASGPKKKEKLEEINSTLKPILVKEGTVKIKISPETLANHLHVLVESNFVSQKEDLYELNLPFLPKKNIDSAHGFVEELSVGLVDGIIKLRPEILKALNSSSLNKIIDPILEKVAETTLKKLAGKSEYEWGAYRRWIEEIDLDAFRDWAAGIKL